MSRSNDPQPRLSSLFLSQWVFNPYQKLLARQLMALGVHVAERSIRKSFFRRALFRDKPDILHLQNIHPLVRGRRLDGCRSSSAVSLPANVSQGGGSQDRLDCA